MKLLIIGPLPPPMTGNSLPVQILHENLPDGISADVINLSKKEHRAGVSSFRRLVEIFQVLWRVARRHNQYDVIYLTIAESTAGNLRDLVLYWLCRRRLNSVVLHMLGGAGMNVILQRRRSVQKRLNLHFLKRIGAIIVEGKPQQEMFTRALGQIEVRIIPNFAQEFLFASPAEIEKKFESTTPLRILFLSNLLPGKGYVELLSAFELLEPELQQRLDLTFAGKATSDRDEKLLHERSHGRKNVRYVGSVFGEEKKNLFAASHIFCLPTYYPYEGQPFSIIEAYAAGCVVITTDHSGIKYIVKEKHNGYFVEKRSAKAIADLLRSIIKASENGHNTVCELREIAVRNHQEARQLYTVSNYLERILHVFNDIYLKSKVKESASRK